MSAYAAGATQPLQTFYGQRSTFISDDERKNLKERVEFTDELLRHIHLRQIYTTMQDAIKPNIFTAIYKPGEIEMNLERSQAITFFKNAIKKIKGISKIAYCSSGEEVAIWTFLKKANRNSLYKISAVERQTIQTHQSLSFDFLTFFSEDISIPPDFKQEKI